MEFIKCGRNPIKRHNIAHNWFTGPFFRAPVVAFALAKTLSAKEIISGMKEYSLRLFKIAFRSGFMQYTRKNPFGLNRKIFLILGFNLVMNKIKIVLTDDHPLHVEGLAMVLKKQSDFDVQAFFTKSSDLLAHAGQNVFDILLLDLHMPGEDGLVVAEKFMQLKHSAKIILLTMQRGGRFMQKAEKLNVKGYLLKSIDVQLLAQKIREVHSGGTCFDDALKNFKLEDDVALKSSVIVEDKPENILSEREKEILILVCKEYSSSQIAEKLFISTGTVDTHRKNILVKLSVNNTVGLVKYALKHGLLND